MGLWRRASHQKTRFSGFRQNIGLFLKTKDFKSSLSTKLYRWLMMTLSDKPVSRQGRSSNARICFMPQKPIYVPDAPNYIHSAFNKPHEVSTHPNRSSWRYSKLSLHLLKIKKFADNILLASRKVNREEAPRFHRSKPPTLELWMKRTAERRSTTTYFYQRPISSLDPWHQAFHRTGYKHSTISSVVCRTSW